MNQELRVGRGDGTVKKAGGWDRTTGPDHMGLSSQGKELESDPKGREVISPR